MAKNVTAIDSLPFNDSLGESLARLARGTPKVLTNLLHDVEVNAFINGTRVSCHCHAIKLDAQGKPRVRDLVQVICDNVLDFAIPRRRISEAIAELQATGSSSKFAHLTREAHSLFTDLAKSGEGGEVLLFVLAERLLKLPQVLCKMPLKTNARMHVHGADGIHVGVDDDTGRLVLYWGESKIFSDATAAIRDCIASLAPMLIDDENGGCASDRDVQLLQRHIDLNDSELETALKEFLDIDGTYYNSVEFRGLCLVGFDCKSYSCDLQGSEGSVDLSTVVAKVTELLPQWKGQIKRRIIAEKLSTFGFHFICVPFPSVDDFRARLRKELKLDSPPAGLASTGAILKAKRVRRKKSEGLT